MTRDVVFISDFFLNEIIGGAEKYNDALIKFFKTSRSVLTVKSEVVTEKVIHDNKDKVFIVANFFLLDESVKLALSDCTYFILEHDHKYVRNNNPSVYPNFLAPQSQIINKQFYINARAVICQSALHSHVLQKIFL